MAQNTRATKRFVSLTVIVHGNILRGDGLDQGGRRAAEHPRVWQRLRGHQRHRVVLGVKPCLALVRGQRLVVRVGEEPSELLESCAYRPAAPLEAQRAPIMTDWLAAERGLEISPRQVPQIGNFSPAALNLTAASYRVLPAW